MATIKGNVTCDDVLYLSVDSDPSAGAGTKAPIGSHAQLTDGNGEYYKFGAGDTQWIKLQQGVQGTQGVQGNNGTQGNQGNSGVQGFQGNAGTQGFQGNQGSQGNQGFQGVQGRGGKASTVNVSYQMIPVDSTASSNFQAVSSVNQVRFFRFELYEELDVKSIHCRINNGVSGNISFGIYSSDGTTRLVYSGVIATVASGVKSVTLGATVMLTQGTYILAWTCDSSSVQFNAAANTTKANEILNASIPQVGSCANAGTAGALPTTLGTLTAQDYQPAIVKLQA